MTDKIRENKEKILRHLLIDGGTYNSYKLARELEMERLEVLWLLSELAKEGKVKLSHGSVKAITEKMSEEEGVKTKSEVKVLKERLDELEKILKFTFRQLGGAIQMGNQKIAKLKLKEDEDNSEDEE